jgi:hypothetical protein
MTEEKIKQFKNPSNEYQEIFNEACKRANSPSDINLKIWEVTKESCREEFENKLSLEKKDLMKEKCRNCGKPAEELWELCSNCGDILQDKLLDIYKERQKIKYLEEEIRGLRASTIEDTRQKIIEIIKKIDSDKLKQELIPKVRQAKVSIYLERAWLVQFTVEAIQKQLLEEIGDKK